MATGILPTMLPIKVPQDCDDGGPRDTSKVARLGTAEESVIWVDEVQVTMRCKRFKMNRILTMATQLPDKA
ncbi:MAG TPA: hypothetical protein VFF30_03395 [Nitrososphaerales archaeon]|nr:hypothetical protein [Nitrososphaerales archaeon]